MCYLDKVDNRYYISFYLIYSYPFMKQVAVWIKAIELWLMKYILSLPVFIAWQSVQANILHICYPFIFLQYNHKNWTFVHSNTTRLLNKKNKIDFLSVVLYRVQKFKHQNFLLSILSRLKFVHNQKDFRWHNLHQRRSWQLQHELQRHSHRKLQGGLHYRPENKTDPFKNEKRTEWE